MVKKWLRIFSPCIIGVMFLLAFIIWAYASRNDTQGWSMLAAYAVLPLLIALVLLDIIARLIFKSNILYLWVTELALILLTGLIFTAYISG